MKRIDLLLNVLDSTFDKESWYAPFKHAIEGLTAEYRLCGNQLERQRIPFGRMLIISLITKKDLLQTWKDVNGHIILTVMTHFYLTKQSNNDTEWKEVVERSENAQRNLRQY